MGATAAVRSCGGRQKVVRRPPHNRQSAIRRAALYGIRRKVGGLCRQESALSRELRCCDSISNSNYRHFTVRLPTFQTITTGTTHTMPTHPDANAPWQCRHKRRVLMTCLRTRHAEIIVLFYLPERRPFPLGMGLSAFGAGLRGPSEARTKSSWRLSKLALATSIFMGSPN